MRLLIVISGICLAFAGCAQPPQDFRAVWTQASLPPAGLQKPVGFKVTPRQACETIAESNSLPLKHVWHIYADSQYYYVHDTFLSDGARRAHKQGVRIDGRTGELVRREP